MDPVAQEGLEDLVVLVDRPVRAALVAILQVAITLDNQEVQAPPVLRAHLEVQEVQAVLEDQVVPEVQVNLILV